MPTSMMPTSLVPTYDAAFIRLPSLRSHQATSANLIQTVADLNRYRIVPN